jgi:hypothetical protein
VIDVLLRALIVGGAAYAGTQLAQKPCQCAGWFADPWGQARLRWFDGVQWTGYTHDGI